MPPKVSTKKAIEPKSPKSEASSYHEEIDNIDADVNYKIQSIHSTELQRLTTFFSDSSMVNSSGDPTTNIV